MKKIIIAVLALVCLTSFCYAAGKDVQKATEPVGAVVETSGVILGKVTNVMEKSAGVKESSLTLADANGRTKIFPLDPTVKIIDATFHALTLNQLKGREVSVEYTKEGGKEKAKTVKVVK